VLNVFEVSADKDDSYGALNSNSITRFNAELNKLPITADVYNEALMRDINASSVEQMISAFTARCRILLLRRPGEHADRPAG